MLEKRRVAKGSRKSGVFKVPYLTVLECSSSSSTTRGLGSEVFGFWREIREWERSYKTPLLDIPNGHSYVTFIRYQ